MAARNSVGECVNIERLQLRAFMMTTNRTSSILRRTMTIGAYLLVALVPLLVNVALFRNATLEPLSDYIPVDSDEVYYWHSALTFSRVGFESGYYTMDEKPSPSGLSRFDNHGIAMPVVMGTIARLFGWRRASLPLANNLFFVAAMLIFLIVTRPRAAQTLLIAALLAVFYPLTLFVLSSYQEVLHLGFAAILGAFFWRLLQPDRGRSRAFVATMILAIGCAAFFRPTWAFLYAPLFFALGRSTSAKRAWLGFALGVAVCGGIMLAWRWLSTPNGYLFYDVVRQNSGSPQQLVGALAQQAWLSVRAFFVPSAKFDETTLLTRPIFTLAAVQRWELIGMILVLCVAPPLVWLRQRRRDATTAPASEAVSRGGEIALHVGNLIFPTIFALLFYDIGAYDLRLLSPHVLMSLLVLIALRRSQWLVTVFVVAQLVVWQAFTQTHAWWIDLHYNYKRENIELFRDAVVRNDIQFDVDRSPWCNTVASFVYPHLHYEYVGLPAGLGATIIFSPTQVELPLKSRYVVMNGYQSDLWRQSLGLRLERLATLPQLMVGLYENLDAKCD